MDHSVRACHHLDSRDYSDPLSAECTMSDSGASAEGGVHVDAEVGVACDGYGDSHVQWVSMFTESRGKAGLNKVIANYNRPFNVLALHAQGDCEGLPECTSCHRCAASAVP